MTKLTLIAATALAGTMALSTAMAADLPSRVAPPPPPILPTLAGWEGLYVGTTYGYSFTEARTRQTTSRSRDIDGQIGGALIGYNFQANRFVIGGEASIDLNVVRGTVPGQAGLNASRVDTLDDVRLRAIVGYDMGWWMPFVAGGAVINETYVSTPNPANYFGEDKRSVGWTAGAGVQAKIDPSQYLRFLPYNIGAIFGPLIFRVEYIHDELPSQTFTLGGGGPGVQQFRTETSSNIVRASAIYRFGDTPPRPYGDALGNVNWAGGYGGIIGAYDSVSTHDKRNGATSHGSAEGGFGGIYAGTNFMFYNNKVMLGLDGSTMIGDATGHGSVPGTTNRTDFREYVRADVRGRVGYAFGNILPFLAAGVDFTRNEQRDLTTGSQVGRVPVDAITAGGGVDYRISQRISVRAEYIHDFSFSNSTIHLNGLNTKQDYDANLGRVGLAYHFE
ncbi:outer membrane beta-barrel protein [Lichenihabitans sp. Uapishka_5]|uniref:outer membrane protein n=1 Tax=Lichenihabitans sp. Uapishka_5 TaxID=3037302 RepID=UPI0029E7D979|nr:outer membrane beta-barrel protein [Lichenihabitans sp. Uapishka_5]MDX7951608.1 outer membrane beta-barrel protein [Lichenihabitans sp. Uapishka_5]